MLEIKDLDVFYGNIQALRKVNIYVNEGEKVALIGANGAGKTTLLKTIIGLIESRNGTITFKGENINRVSPWNIVAKGIALVPEGRQVFPEMTVLENLEMGAYIYINDNKKKESINQVFELFPRLKEREKQIAGTLSGGEQQMLAIGRALMSRPKLLLLDEPSMGLAPILVEGIFDIISDIKRKMNATILLVEQNAKKALSVVDRGYVLETGEITMENNAKELINNKYIKEAYLGI
jgi:branched-chain amino acid transport system ATP-binding protein